MSFRRVSLALGGAVLLSTLAVSAQASEDGTASGRTCAVGAEPIDLRAGVPARSALPEPQVDCFPTFAEAISFVTGGGIEVDSPAELTRAVASGGEFAAAASVLLGIEYTGSGYSGSSGSGCGSSTTYGFPSMPSGWNNVISSARSYSGCWSTHYDGTSYTGTRRTCPGACSSMGTMNNRTSSIVFRPVGTTG